MTTDPIDVEYSRAARLAAAVAGESENAVAKRFADARVVVSFDPDLPGAEASAEFLLTTLRRQAGELYLDTAGLESHSVRGLEAKAAAVDPTRPLRLGRCEAPTAEVHIGTEECAPTRVIPDRHGLRVAREGTLHQLGRPSGLGIASAAASAATEIFKDVARVNSSKHVKHRQLHFCPVSLSDDLEAAPATRSHELDLALVGLGAVGTATAKILGLLPFAGNALLVDPEQFAPENRGTYSLGGAEQAHHRVQKTMLGSAALPNFEVVRFDDRIEHAITLIDSRQLPWPRIVLSGLDSIEARHATQLIWPDLLIDSATGGTACGVHVCPAGEACLMCLLPFPVSGISSVERLASETTLPTELLLQGDRLLSEADLMLADEARRAGLRLHLGTPMCGLARAVGLLEDADEDYLPAIPFVAQQAACLGVGRLIAALEGGVGQGANVIQYDSLLGADLMTTVALKPRVDCYSVRRRRQIEMTRLSRERLRNS